MILRLLNRYAGCVLACWAYSFQTFSALEVLGAAKMNQIEVNIRDHVHGSAGVVDIPFATQVQMEAATSLVVAVPPGRQHFHPGHPKAWVKFNSAGTIASSYNITSITDTGVGNWEVQIATDFSSFANFCGFAFGGLTAAAAALTFNTFDQAAGTFSISGQIASTPTDPGNDDVIHAVFLGDQA